MHGHYAVTPKNGLSQWKCSSPNNGRHYRHVPCLTVMKLHLVSVVCIMHIKRSTGIYEYAKCQVYRVGQKTSMNPSKCCLSAWMSLWRIWLFQASDCFYVLHDTWSEYFNPAVISNPIPMPLCPRFFLVTLFPVSYFQCPVLNYGISLTLFLPVCQCIYNFKFIALNFICHSDATISNSLRFLLQRDFYHKIDDRSTKHPRV